MTQTSFVDAGGDSNETWPSGLFSNAFIAIGASSTGSQTMKAVS